MGGTFTPVPPERIDDRLKQLQTKIRQFEEFLLRGGNPPDRDAFVTVAQERHDLVQLQLALAKEENPQVTMGKIRMGSLVLPPLRAPMHPIVLSPEVACRRMGPPEARGQADLRMGAPEARGFRDPVLPPGEIV